jgi:hypothetical protein
MPPMNSVEQLFTGIFETLIFVLALVVVIYWLVFPIIVARYLKDILNSLRKTEQICADCNTLTKNKTNDRKYPACRLDAFAVNRANCFD